MAQQTEMKPAVISQFHENFVNSISIARWNHAALCFSSAISMVMIKPSEDAHMFWLQFECKSVQTDDVAFLFVEVKLNRSDLIRQSLMVFAFKNIVLACEKILK